MVLKGTGCLESMGSGMKQEGVDQHDGGAADFLRRLSIADAKVLLERTRKEKEAKTKEMHKMIGVRYRDLIDSADKIVSMHSAAMRLETSLKEMPDKWKQMEAKLASTLSRSEQYLPRATNGHIEHYDGRKHVDETVFESVHERVLFIVTSHEQLWLRLDRGESNEALALYHKAKAIYESQEVQDEAATYSFLPSIWASVRSFEQRVRSVAEVCLTSRGRSAKFYADNLDALSSLGCTSSVSDLLKKFLESRTKWLELNDPHEDNEEKQGGVSASAGRQMRLNLRSLLVTILHAEEIFLVKTSPSSKDELAFCVHHEKELADPTTLAATTKTINHWYSTQMMKVSDHARAVVNRVPTIAQIAQTQSQLAKIERQYAAYRTTDLWKAQHAANSPTIVPSMFETLFGDALRRRTRDLVQHSFVDATNAIKNDVRRCLKATSDGGKSVRQLKSVNFYDFFESIHNKVAGLDSSELQRVLSEEYMRALFSFVVFLEAEYPWSSPTDSYNPGYLLSLANILMSILTVFPSRKKALFGDCDDDPTSSRRLELSADMEVFKANESDGRLSRQALQTVMEHSDKSTNASSFIEDELRSVDSLGLFAFCTISRVRGAEPYAAVFVGILRGLAEKYCEAWARCLLQQKIAPLRDFLQVEHYDVTNEEWISSHQGWSEQVIIDDDLSDETPEGEEIPKEGEKVWLPWCETPTVSSFLFSCCYALDEAYRLVRTATGATQAHVSSMHELIRLVLTEQLTILSVDAYEEAVDLVVNAKGSQSRNVLNFGECCMLQFLFDMYFVRATLGFSDFIRFGWGDEIDLATCTPSLARLKQLFDRMHDFIDPVDWEIYGPQLIENVVIQFRKSRLLFSSLSEANDINEINGKLIVVSAQDTRPIIKLAEAVPRFSLLPVPSARRRSPASLAGPSSTAVHGNRSSSGRAESLFHEPTAESAGSPALPSLKLQNLLSSTTGSNLLSAAASGTNLLTSAAKGMSFLSSATSSYLREGGNTDNDSSRSKYF